MPEWLRARGGNPELFAIAGLPLLIGLAFGAVGLAFVVSAWRQWARAREQRERWVRGGAVVVGYEIEGGRHQRQYPILQYTLPDGRSVETRADLCANWRLFGEGQVVALYYDPLEPRQVQIEHWLQDLVPAVRGLLGVVAAGAGLVTLLTGLLLAVLGLRV